jgi:hypothetical protein
MELSSAKATFASPSRTVQFTNNFGRYGPALRAQGSTITFGGPLVVTNNEAWRGAGGSFSLESSDVTFNGVTTFRSNKLDGCTMVRVC